VAEQQGFEHLVGQGSAVHGQKGGTRSLASGVEEAGHHILADTRGAGYQQGCVGRSRAVGKVEQGAACGIFGDGAVLPRGCQCGGQRPAERAI